MEELSNTIEQDTLTPEQIENWRKMIFIRLEQISPGTGCYATIMPESEIIAYWKRMKEILESPEQFEQPKIAIPETHHPKRKVCTHKNSFVGNKGRYCFDCEQYI